MNNKKIYIVGGGTFNFVRAHLALAAPSFGSTARLIKNILEEDSEVRRVFDIELCLTKMADSNSNIVTNSDLHALGQKIANDRDTKIVFWTPAVCDFVGQIGDKPSGKMEERLSSSKEYEMKMKGDDKIVSSMRKNRKDFTLIAFKTTTNLSDHDMYERGLGLLKNASANLVLVNDISRRKNLIVTPEEAYYHSTMDREEAIRNLVDMALLRSHLTFTRSTVIDASPVPWNSDLVPGSLRTVVDYCVNRNAYKPFRGKTVGHFACKLNDTEFLTSIRKSNFNFLNETGLVRVVSNGPDSVLAYGAKPSVGGQSQRVIFRNHEGYDCIVHFHCPMKENSDIPVASQREYECGSHECGENTSNNLKEFNYNGTKIKAVMLDNHGPNIIFNKAANPLHVIQFIENNFDLMGKTGGIFRDLATEIHRGV